MSIPLIDCGPQGSLLFGIIQNYKFAWIINSSMNAMKNLENVFFFSFIFRIFFVQHHWFDQLFNHLKRCIILFQPFCNLLPFCKLFDSFWLTIALSMSTSKDILKMEWIFRAISCHRCHINMERATSTFWSMVKHEKVLIPTATYKKKSAREKKKEINKMFCATDWNKSWSLHA